MRMFRTRVAATVAIAALFGGLFQIYSAGAAEAPKKPLTPAQEEGKKLAFDTFKGNCLACHMMEGGESPGNIAPPLIAMQARYPDKAKLRAQIWDATAINPSTSMPPFGRHQIFTEEEIDKVVDFVYSL